MPESEELYAQVDDLTAEVREHGVILRTLLRTQAPELRENILEAVAADETLGFILSMIDGERTQGDVLEAARAGRLPNSHKAGISRRFNRLLKLGLISYVTRTAQGKVYKRTVLDDALGISEAIGSR